MKLHLFFLCIVIGLAASGKDGEERKDKTGTSKRATGKKSSVCRAIIYSSVSLSYSFLSAVDFLLVVFKFVDRRFVWT